MPSSSAPLSTLIIILLWLLLKLEGARSLSCSGSENFSRNRIYEHCNDLPHLGSHLHWTYSPSNSSLSIAFSAPPKTPSGWVAWAINPKGTGMVGSQALVAFREGNGSVAVKTFRLLSYKRIEQGKLASVEVGRLEAEQRNGALTIFATIAIPENMKIVNQVWQVGASVVDGMPAVHDFGAANLESKGKLDLLRGQNTGNSADEVLRRKRIHGILNAISWGFLFPMGIMIARYMRTFRFAEAFWFYLHVGIQFSSYSLGVAGWATGLKLRAESKGVVYTSHRIIGIIVFSLATLQMLAMFVRPSKDHKYRTYWNIYHHGIGYSILVLGVLNVFKGIEILAPPREWKLCYIALLVLLGLISLSLEVTTWTLLLRNKNSNKSRSRHDVGFINGSKDNQEPLAS
ncbi:hypothetical protein CDL15_Pgr000327 [Punica granatum]|uniref:Cytochrome b561 and DOMON domain-containing protein n=1 Tax=Punica granatum TaxID=22663 RepID=A0A218XSW1_PUNGR|nr:hypothetical protein CDL15_Pgr000327 [Punica granatum]